MGDRYWLERRSYWLLSQRLYSVHQVIWSLRAPAELHRVFVHLTGSSARVCACVCGEMQGQGDEKTDLADWAEPQRKSQWTSLPFKSQWYHQVDSFVCFSFVSRFLLLNFLPNSSSFPGMITRPKNAFLQVFNTPSLKRGPSGCFVCALLF